jgi:hypothetical protein
MSLGEEILTEATTNRSTHSQKKQPQPQTQPHCAPHSRFPVLLGFDRCWRGSLWVLRGGRWLLVGLLFFGCGVAFWRIGGCGESWKVVGWGGRVVVK